jgi:hypothetical protein
MSGRGFGHRLSVGWVFWYTRRVPWAVAAARRDEMISDLWEQADEAARSGHGGLAHQLAVIRRTLAGIPADLSWRRAARRHSLRPEAAAAALALGFREQRASRRWACRIVTHRERRLPYPGNDEGGGHYYLCMRCGRVRDDTELRLGHGLIRFEDREQVRQREVSRLRGF